MTMTKGRDLKDLDTLAKFKQETHKKGEFFSLEIQKFHYFIVNLDK